MRVMLFIIFLSFCTWILIFKNNYTIEEKEYYNKRIISVMALHVFLVALVGLATFIPYLRVVPMFIDFIVLGTIDHIFGRQALLGTPWRMWLLLTLVLIITAGATTITREYIKYNRKKHDYEAYKAKEKAEREAKADNALRHDKNANKSELDKGVEQNILSEDVSKNTKPELEPEGLIDTSMSDDEVASSGAKLGRYAYVTNGVWMLSDDEYIDFINKKYHTNHPKLGDISLYDFKTGERAW